MITVKRTKTYDKKLFLVKNINEIDIEYHHLGNDNTYYVFEKDQHSIKDLEYFINNKLIFAKL